MKLNQKKAVIKIIKSGIVKIIFKAFLAFLEVLVDLLQEETGTGNEEEPEPEEIKNDTFNLQYFLFPMETLRITQDELEEHSHKGSYAIDFGGSDEGQDILYAPCDLIVKRIRENANGEIYLESIDEVQFADGTVDYAHILLLHDNNTYENKVGDIIRQGQAFYKEGGMYNGNPNYYGNHVHIEAGKGKWKNCKQYQNEQGTWISENMCSLSSLFWLKKNTKIIDARNHNFKFAP